MYLVLRNKKDHYNLLSKKTLLTLRQYSLQYQPKKWLLEGEDGDNIRIVVFTAF